MGFQIGFPALRNYPPIGPVYDTDAQAMFDARESLGDPVPVAYKDAINQFVLDLKAISGFWEAITQLVVMAGATTVAGALVPIKGATPTHSNLVAGDIGIKTGIKGNGSSKHIDSNVLGNSFSLNNAHTYAFVTEAGTTSTRSIYGHGGTGGGSTRMNWGSISVCQANTGDNHTSTSIGGYGMSRDNGSNYDRMLANSVTLITRTSFSPVPAGRYFLLGRSTLGNVAENWFDGRILLWALGTATDISGYITPVATLESALAAI